MIASRASDVAARIRDVTLQEREDRSRSKEPAANPSRNEAEATTRTEDAPLSLSGDIASRKRRPEPAEGLGRERPKRLTLDLSRAQHRFLKLFALESDAEMSQVMRVLLDLLQNDVSLASRVRARIEESRGR